MRSFFNILLFSFLMIVTLIPLKVKIGLVPLSADFVFGSALILVGILYLISFEGARKELKRLLKNKDLKTVLALACVILFISFLSIIYAKNRTAALTETLRLGEYMMIFTLVAAITDEKTIERCFKVFYFAMLFACVFGIAQIFFNWSKFLVGGFWGKERIYATFVNPNYWGAALNLVIFYPIINLLEKKKFLKLDLSILVIFLINMLFCSTRGAWIGFACGLLVIFLIRYRNRFIYLLGSFALIYLIPSIRDRFGEALYIQERFNIWKTGLYMFKDHVLLGVGNGNYIYNYKEYLKKYQELLQRKPQYSTHNSYIKMFSELGFLGGLTFVLLYLKIFHMIYTIYKGTVKYKMIALAFTGFGITYLIQNLFNNLIFVPQLNVLVWIISALLLKGFLLENEQHGSKSVIPKN